MLKPALMVIGTVLTATSLAVAQATVEEKVVGRSAPQTQAYLVSPTGVHYAVITPKGTRTVVVVDGVEGPEFDVFLSRQGRVGPVAGTGVIFSPDGSRHAYFGGIGNQYILVVDGKELVRGELGPSNLSYHELQFSPGGKHVYFIDLKSANGIARAQLVMDGKPGPPSGHQNIFPVFSPDESRWAYNAGKFGGRPEEKISVVDGKEVPFIGYSPLFTADNKLITSLQNRITDPAMVAIDGKSVAPGVSTGGKIGVAPVGSRWAGVVQPKKAGDVTVLYLDGKPVPEAQNVEEVIFSPDGKRYMAICRNNATRAKYVVLDGKKGPEYQTIVPGLIRFTPDASRAIYVGNNAGKNFVVVDGQPSEGFAQLVGQVNRVAMSQTGGRYGYVAGDGTGVNQTLIIDGKPVPLDGKGVVPETLSFSADGSRYAYVGGRRSQGMGRFMVVDGVEVPGIALSELSIGQNMQGWWTNIFGAHSKFYQFSPDGRHIFYTGVGANEPGFAVFVDGKRVFGPVAGGVGGYLTWSPDSKHLFWTAVETRGPQPVSRVFVDGKPSPVKFSGLQPTDPGVWQVGTDGVLQFLVFEGAVAKRYRITPGNDTSIETMLAAAK